MLWLSEVIDVVRRERVEAPLLRRLEETCHRSRETSHGNCSSFRNENQRTKIESGWAGYTTTAPGRVSWHPPKRDRVMGHDSQSTPHIRPHLVVQRLLEHSHHRVHLVDELQHLGTSRPDPQADKRSGLLLVHQHVIPVYDRQGEPEKGQRYG